MFVGLKNVFLIISFFFWGGEAKYKVSLLTESRDYFAPFIRESFTGVNFFFLFEKKKILISIHTIFSYQIEN